MILNRIDLMSDFQNFVNIHLTFVTITVSVIVPFLINIKVLFCTFGRLSKRNKHPPLRYQKLENKGLGPRALNRV